MDWKAQNNIWSFKASKLSSLPKQLSPPRLPKATAVLLSRRLRIRRSGRQPQAEAENQ